MPTKTHDCQKLADDILKRITWYPESYDQTTWQTVAKGFLKRMMPNTRKLVGQKAKTKAALPTLQNCQTTGCIAGTASIIVGDIPAVALNPESLDHYGDNNIHLSSVITPEGEERHIQERGAELLCLTQHEQSWLFAAGRTLPEVVWALREISEGKRISCQYEAYMTREQLAEINTYRHQLRQQKPKMNYVATNKLVPRKVREAAEAKKAKVKEG